MAKRPTKKAGLPKTRLENLPLQRSLDAIVERLEVLDGLRGDSLDQAVTFRDMGDSGFTITGRGGGGGLNIGGGTDTGGSGTDTGDSPVIGPPSSAPSSLTVTDVFLALLLSWDNPSFSVAHIEIHRWATDDLSSAVMIGTTVGTKYVDYVGESAAYYYWVRAVGTDGSTSAFNAIPGTLGTTGLDPSDFEFNINIAGSNLDTELAARIDLIDVDGAIDSIMTRLEPLPGEVLALDARSDVLESNYTGVTVPGIAANTGLINDANALIGANATSIETNTTSITGTVVPPGSWGAEQLASIGANSSRILTLEASVGAIDSSAGKNWEFITDVESFTASNASLVHQGAGSGSVVFTPTGALPYLLSPVLDPVLSGSINTQVIVRVKRDSSGGTWAGNLKYRTAGHGISGSFVKTIPDPNLLLGEWKILTWDMSNLTTPAGSADWVNTPITQIQLELVSDAGGQFTIDWIQIAKFSTTAISEAISALDVRVGVNEDGITASASDIALLQSTVNGAEGVVATAAALSALTTDVNVTNAGNITANADAITALDVKIYDPVLGAVAQSTAYQQLSTAVTVTNAGLIEANAQSILELSASIGSGVASLVNPLTTVGENYDTSYSAAEIQAFAVGSRAGVGARVATSGNNLDTLRGAGDARIKIDPDSIYEVKFSVYHDRPVAQGSFFAGVYAYQDLTDGTLRIMDRIRGGVVTLSNSTPLWLGFDGGDHDEQWLDVTCYILGYNVDPALCPTILVNGNSNPTGFDVLVDGLQVTNLLDQWIELRFLNYNVSPFGNSTETTAFVTDVSLHRVDSSGSTDTAAIQQQLDVVASEVDGLSALYAVKTELTAGGVPYVAGFGIAANLIPGGSGATSAFGIRADQFFMTGPNDWAEPTDDIDRVYPFTIGIVDDEFGDPVSQVAIRGELIVNGSINATSIVAGDIGAREINVLNLQALAVDTGVLRIQRMTTGQDGSIEDPEGIPGQIGSNPYSIQQSYRVELEAAGAAWPIWYGSGAKSAPNGRFYVDTSGNVTVKGLLDAGMIRQSFFAPAGDNQSFRVATQYPSFYSNGEYTGKKAHLNAMQHMNFYSPNNFGTSIFSGGTFFGWNSNSIGFVGPIEGSNAEYNRLGSYSEMILIDIACQIEIAGEEQGAAKMHAMYLQYRYDSEGWKDAYFIPIRRTNALGSASLSSVSAFHSQVFVSRSQAWSTLNFRLRAAAASTSTTTSQIAVVSAALKATTPNFGYADLSTTDRTGTALRIDLLTQAGLWR